MRPGVHPIVFLGQQPVDVGGVNMELVLENGRIRLSGTAEELDQNPEVRRAYLGVA